jgi:V/A-type H+-transporting ATPase subunit K
MELSVALALGAAGVSVGLAAIGSSLGIGAVGQVSAGLLSQDPKKFAQALILSALPSTQALYGLLYGFLVLIQTGILGGNIKTFDINVGLGILLSALPVGLACLGSGIGQGKIAAGGVRILAEKPENLTQAIVLAALAESFAVFGLVVSLLILLVGLNPYLQ